MPATTSSYLKEPQSIEHMIELRGYLLGQSGEHYINKSDFMLLLNAHIESLKTKGSSSGSEQINRPMIAVDLGEQRAGTN